MSTLTLRYDFEELPLSRTHGGTFRALADGFADISYGPSGNWEIKAVKVRLDQEEGEVTHSTTPEGLVEFLIKKQLKAEPWKGRIQEKVEEELDAMARTEVEFEPEVL
jgi:hypothetical protein